MVEAKPAARMRRNELARSQVSNCNGSRKVQHTPYQTPLVVLRDRNRIGVRVSNWGRCYAFSTDSNWVKDTYAGVSKKRKRRAAFEPGSESLCKRRRVGAQAELRVATGKGATFVRTPTSPP